MYLTRHLLFFFFYFSLFFCNFLYFITPYIFLWYFIKRNSPIFTSALGESWKEKTVSISLSKTFQFFSNKIYEGDRRSRDDRPLASDNMWLRFFPRTV